MLACVAGLVAAWQAPLPLMKHTLATPQHASVIMQDGYIHDHDILFTPDDEFSNMES